MRNIGIGYYTSFAMTFGDLKKSIASSGCKIMYTNGADSDTTGYLTCESSSGDIFYVYIDPYGVHLECEEVDCILRNYKVVSQIGFWIDHQSLSNFNDILGNIIMKQGGIVVLGEHLPRVYGPENISEMQFDEFFHDVEDLDI